MKKAVLINMPVRVGAQPNVVPTGVGIMASELEYHGFDCSVIDLNVYRPVKNRDQIQDMFAALSDNYQLVGLSGMITTLKSQQEISSLVRERWPAACIVSGGGLASDFGEKLFDWIPELNIVVKGEGEPHVKALASINLNGQIRMVIGPQPVSNIDQVAEVAWDKFDLDTYLSNDIWGKEAGNSSWTAFKMSRSINLISSRGCPYQCNFCDRNATGGRNYRLASPFRILNDIDQVIDRFNVDFIGFLDDNFLSDRKRLGSLLPALKLRDISWGCHARMNDVDEDLALQLRDAGCLYIGFGAESADETVLKNMNKKHRPSQMKRAVQSCNQAGITPNCTWIMGYPGETIESLKRTVSFILEHELSQKSMFVATAYPGTKLFDQVKGQIQKIYPELKEYVLDLDDATKLLGSKSGILNYSEIPDEQFIALKQIVEEGRLEEVIHYP